MASLIQDLEASVKQLEWQLEKQQELEEKLDCELNKLKQEIEELKADCWRSLCSVTDS